MKKAPPAKLQTITTHRPICVGDRVLTPDGELAAVVMGQRVSFEPSPIALIHVPSRAAGHRYDMLPVRLLVRA